MKKHVKQDIEPDTLESGPFIRKFREKRTFVIECRYTRPFSLPTPIADMLREMREWRTWRKYASLRDAEAALATLSKKGHGYEYRMASTQPSDGNMGEK